jgi:hypothetical protein
MHAKSIITMLLLLALFATITMARNLQQNEDNDMNLDKTQFSLRDLSNLMLEKRDDRPAIFGCMESCSGEVCVSPLWTGCGARHPECMRRCILAAVE